MKEESLLLLSDLQKLINQVVLIDYTIIILGGERMKGLRQLIKEFAMEEDAVGVVEIILILVVLISLVIIFKEQLTSLVKKILSKITKQSNSI